MRVIAGKYKGRKILCPKGREVRPTTDKVKEAMFGSIQFDLPGARVLDAFAGSGALGLEALSRGAAHVDFVENDRDAVRFLKENLKIAEEESYSVIFGDAMELSGRRYDIAILDPPYDSGLYEAFLKHADSEGLLEPGARVIAECRNRFDFAVPVKYNLTKRKSYGDIALWFLEYGG